jgi:hypothetical protein
VIGACAGRRERGLQFEEGVQLALGVRDLVSAVSVGLARRERLAEIRLVFVPLLAPNVLAAQIGVAIVEVTIQADVKVFATVVAGIAPTDFDLEYELVPTGVTVMGHRRYLQKVRSPADCWRSSDGEYLPNRGCSSVAMRNFICTLLLALTAATAACTTTRAAHPADTVKAYHRAVHDRDSDAVYALLDEDGRLGMDPETFARYFESHYDGIVVQADQLLAGAGDGDDIEVHAAVPLEAGQEAELVWRRDSWWLAQTAPTRGAQASPQQTLDAFRSALAGRNLDATLALLSTERRGAYLAELDLFRKSMERTDGEEIVTNGDTAIVALDGGDKLILVREDGVWRVHGWEAGR